MAIDDPREKIRDLVKDPDFDSLDAALQVAGLASPFFKVASVAKNILEQKARMHKVLIAIRTLCDEFDRSDSERRKELDDFIETPWFKKAVVVLAEESGRATDVEHAKLLARFAAHGCFPQGLDAHRKEDLASYIHDLARLGEDDIQMLRLLGDSYKEVLKNDQNLHDPNFFTNHNERFKLSAQKLNIHPDDCLALGARLSGFGLAFESVPQEQHFFRPTRRGFYLLSLLEAAELPVEKQN
jgi:hypothetical protein